MAAAQSKEMLLFSKKLTRTDIEHRLAVPTIIIRSLPNLNGGHTVEIPLVHGRKTWTIVYAVRKQKHKKPEFRGEWKKFVTAESLKVNDRITIYKVQDGRSFHYRAEVDRSAVSNQDRTIPSRAFSLNHQVDETELGNDQQQLPEAADTLVEANTKCFGGIMKDIGMGEINFFGLDAEAMGYGYGCGSRSSSDQLAAGNTVTDQSVSLELVLGQPTSAAEQMNLDLILAPPNA
ncbi:hypothetical protein V6N13_080724 [Hibiscus sabdariffa]|uniref:TF-B3 domain-containing protein n=1 Tax=Hibiscus sabdariffa TaxID=183260 RepID=A0ABR2CBJ2_9ROSI